MPEMSSAHMKLLFNHLCDHFPRIPVYFLHDLISTFPQEGENGCLQHPSRPTWWTLYVRWGGARGKDKLMTPTLL